MIKKQPSSSDKKTRGRPIKPGLIRAKRTVGAKVDDAVHQRMEKFPEINWSTVVRVAVMSKLEELESRMK